MTCLRRSAGGSPGDFYPAKGNHDFTIRDKPNSPDGWTLSGKAARDVLMDTAAVREKVVTNPDDPEGCYYWFDSPGTGVRYIVADTTDSIRTDRTYWAVKYGIGERQLMWLAENALMTLPAGWCAVVMHHIPVAEIVSGESGVPQTFAPWRSLLEAYQSRGVATVGGRKFDFSSAQGRILCSLTGHEHAERQTYRNGLWHITEPCDAAYSDYIVGSSPWCAGLPKKEKGTIFEQTFDAIHIDRRNNALHFTRIGGGADRTVRLAPLHLVAGEAVKLDGTEDALPHYYGAAKGLRAFLTGASGGYLCKIKTLCCLDVNSVMHRGICDPIRLLFGQFRNQFPAQGYSGLFADGIGYFFRCHAVQKPGRIKIFKSLFSIRIRIFRTYGSCSERGGSFFSLVTSTIPSFVISTTRTWQGSFFVNSRRAAMTGLSSASGPSSS